MITALVTALSEYPRRRYGALRAELIARLGYDGFRRLLDAALRRMEAA